MEQVYTNANLKDKSMAYAYIGSVFLKELCKANKVKCEINVKKYRVMYIIPKYACYIEIKLESNKKIIIDNLGSYDYQYFKDHTLPREIEKISAKDIKEIVSQVYIPLYEDNLIVNTIRVSAFQHYLDKIVGIVG